MELWSASIPALLREGLRCLFVAVLFLVNIKQWKAYRNIWKRSWISLGAILLFSVLVSYVMQDKGWNDVLIGIKYGFWRLVILLSASGIGFFYRENFTGEKWAQRRSRLLRGLYITVIAGFFRQALKLVRPEFFSRIGYELHLDDRQFDQKPPLYYLTGWEGTLRRQGLFSGPNNYGYFLVAFFPLILQLRKHL
ncbi:MAG: hypothetical protein LBG52_00820 [Candidatus Peribacteria bacterium]|nr:hypothetical protein [Candidatus Peribacteria bacterium]